MSPPTSESLARSNRGISVWFSKNEDGLELDAVTVEMRQHDRRQPRFVPVGHTVQKQRDVVPALDAVVHGVSLRIRHFRFVVSLDFRFVYETKKAN